MGWFLNGKPLKLADYESEYTGHVFDPSSHQRSRGHPVCRICDEAEPDCKGPKRAKTEG